MNIFGGLRGFAAATQPMDRFIYLGILLQSVGKWRAWFESENFRAARTFLWAQ
jgi:hypothetical protein